MATTKLFAVSVALPFPECHTVGLMQHVAFADWILSLSHMHLNFLHIFSWIDSPYILALNNIPLSGCTTIYPFTCWHLGCFQVLTIVIKIAITIHMQIFCVAIKFSTFLGKYQWAQLLDRIVRYGESIFSFVISHQTIFQSANYILHSYLQWIRSLFAPCAHRYLMSPVFWILVILMDV